MATLREMLEAAADEAGISGGPGLAGATEWSLAGRPFARLDAAGRTASFRLDVTLAAAARRTPDTSASGEGPAWVDFSPPQPMDGHAADRAAAWFAAAARRTRD